MIEEVQSRRKGLKIKCIQEVWMKHLHLSDVSRFTIEVSNLGLVRRERATGEGWHYYSQHIKKKSNKLGQWFVSINAKQYPVHQLVWEAFHGHWRDLNLLIDHINGISLDNRLVNLRLMTISDKSSKGNKDDSRGLF